MRGTRNAAALIIAPLLLGGCTFGTLRTDRCLAQYRAGMMAAVAEGDAGGGIAKESYDFCIEGEARAQAMVAMLQSHGFTTSGPARHFEVPGGRCLAADRDISPGTFDPERSLGLACALGHRSRAYMTGGTLTRPDGASFHIRSSYETRDR